MNKNERAHYLEQQREAQTQNVEELHTFRQNRMHNERLRRNCPAISINGTVEEFRIGDMNVSSDHCGALKFTLVIMEKLCCFHCNQ